MPGGLVQSSIFGRSDICAGFYCRLPCDDGVTICDDVAPRPVPVARWPSDTRPVTRGGAGRRPTLPLAD